MDLVPMHIVLAVLAFISLGIIGSHIQDRFFPTERAWHTDDALKSFFGIPLNESGLPVVGIGFGLIAALVILCHLIFAWAEKASGRTQIVALLSSLMVFVALPIGLFALESLYPSEGPALRHVLHERLEREHRDVVEMALAPGVVLTKRLHTNEGPMLCVESNVPLSVLEDYYLYSQPILEDGKATGLRVYRTRYTMQSEPRVYCPNYKVGYTWMVQYYIR